MRKTAAILLGVLAVLRVDMAHAAIWEMKPFPEDQRGATIKVDNTKLSRWGLASGNYIAKNGQIVLFNYFGGPSNAAAAGLVGLSVDALHQNAQVKSLAPLADGVTFDLRPATQSAVTTYLAPMLTGQAATPSTLTISPFAYFVQEQPGAFRIRILLRAALADKSGKQKWQNDYYCPAAELRPLQGAESWFEQGRYEQAATRAIERIVPVLGRDLLGQLKTQKIVLLAAGVKWDTRVEFPAAVMEESDDWLVVRDMPGGKKLASDVDLIDKHNAEIKPFTGK